LLTVTKVTAFNKVVGDFVPTATRTRQFDRVKRVVSITEVVTDGVNFVDELLDAVDSEVSDGFFNFAVVLDLQSLSVDFDSTAFVYELLDGFYGRVSPSDEWISAKTSLVKSSLKSIQKVVFFVRIIGHVLSTDVLAMVDNHYNF